MSIYPGVDERGRSALRGRGRGPSGSRATGGGGGGPFDPSSYVLGELLGMYNQQPTMQGGTPGYTVSRAAERSAVTKAKERAEKDRASNYADIDADIKARAPGIQKGYDDASAGVSADARKRALETRAALLQRERDAAQAAQRMGLSVNPGATEGAGEVAESFIGRENAQAGAWKGFNSSSAQRALERNTAVGDTFAWEGQQQRQALANMLIEALAGLQDQYVPGTAGRMVGGLSDSERLKVLGMVDDIGNETWNQELETAKLRQGTDYSAAPRSGGMSNPYRGRNAGWLGLTG